MADLRMGSSAVKIWVTNDVGTTFGLIDNGGPALIDGTGRTGYLTKRIILKAYPNNTGVVYIQDQNMVGGSYQLLASETLTCHLDNTNLLRIAADGANQGLMVYMELQTGASQ